MPKLHSLSNMLQTVSDLLLDALRFARGILQPRAALAAENLFLRKQLALYLERQVKPQRARKPQGWHWCYSPDFFRGDQL